MKPFRGGLLLAVAAQQEEELRLEGVACPIAVEIREERILVEGLEDGAGPEPGLEQARERGLSNADDASIAMYG